MALAELQPIATIIASIVAAGAAIKFGSIQAGIAAQQVSIAKAQADTAKAMKEIAESQRDIAYDKLKADLFQHRFEIFKAAMELTRTIGTLKEGDPRYRELRDKISEAPFFFPAKEQEILLTIILRSYDYFKELRNREKEADESAKTEARKRAEEALSALFLISFELPTKMEKELGFAQLVGKPE
jgi:hypothetical protein